MLRPTRLVPWPASGVRPEAGSAGRQKGLECGRGEGVLHRASRAAGEGAPASAATEGLGGVGTRRASLRREGTESRDVTCVYL